MTQIKFCNRGLVSRHSFNDTCLEIPFAEASYTVRTFAVKIHYFAIEICHLLFLLFHPFVDVLSYLYMY